VTFGDRKAQGYEARLRAGVRNLFDKDPPLTSEGYLGSLYNPYARYWYTSISLEY
jgi:outer membrane receptor protein involved in Fe transport